MSWAPLGLRKLPINLALVCVALGFGMFSTGWLPFDPDPRKYDGLTERLSELVVIVSLMGAGLKLDRPLGWKRWSTTWRLLAIAMPLTIGATALVGVVGLGFSLAMAMLLGAALAPTDPVLAADVQVGPPGSRDDDEVRFGLTSEAGLNDSLAFPFVHLAIVAAAGGLAVPSELAGWFGVDVVWKLSAGAGVGHLLGRLLGHLMFLGDRSSLARLGDGLVGLGATLITYAATEVVHGYGFLAVFVCGLTIRASERHHEFHEELHRVADQSERLVMMLLLVLFGGALAHGLLATLAWTDVALCLVVLLVVRPIAGMVAMAGSPHPLRERALLAFLGIRGLGTVYYVAYGLNHGDFGDSERLWAVVGCTILASIVIHGVTASPLMLRIAGRRAPGLNARPGGGIASPRAHWYPRS